MNGTAKSQKHAWNFSLCWSLKYTFQFLGYLNEMFFFYAQHIWITFRGMLEMQIVVKEIYHPVIIKFIEYCLPSVYFYMLFFPQQITPLRAMFENTATTFPTLLQSK